MAYHTPGLGQAEQVRERARALYAAGQESYRAGDYRRAVANFQQAYETLSLPPVLVALAMAHLSLGNLSEARRYAEEYLRRDPQGGQAQAARAILAKMTDAATATAAREVPKDVAPGPMDLPSSASVYEERSTVGIWVVTGVGALALIGIGYYMMRPRKVAANRRRRTSRR